MKKQLKNSHVRRGCHHILSAFDIYLALKRKLFPFIIKKAGIGTGSNVLSLRKQPERLENREMW